MSEETTDLNMWREGHMPPKRLQYLSERIAEVAQTGDGDIVLEHARRLVHGLEQQPYTTPEDRARLVVPAVQNMLYEVDPTSPREGTDETPRRVAEMWCDELCSGYDKDPSDVLKTFASGGYDGMIVQRNIPFVSTCEHHLVPIMGHAHIGYFPNGRIVGLSKFKRVVDIFARRLQVQERVTRQVCGALENALHPRGVIVVVEAEHLCMTIRGVQSPGTTTTTSAVTGLFNTNEEGEKEEFFSLIRRRV